MFKTERFSLFLFVLGVVSFLLPVPRLAAQYENGSLLGTIRDTTGAPIPGAAVTVTNTATGVSSETKTDTEGNYDVPQLRVGVYSVVASATGFSKAANWPE